MAKFFRCIVFFFVLLAQVFPRVSEGETPSVYRLSPWLDGSILVAAGLVNIVPQVFASQIIHPRCPCDPAELNPLDRSVVGNFSATADTLSNVTVALALTAPLLANYLDTGGGSVWLEDTAIFLETLVVNSAFVTVAKYTFQRPLPVVYGGQAPELIHDPGGYRSFYSGHTSTLFSALSSAAMTLTLRRGFQAWPWLVTFGAGASVAAERVLAGRHFYSDVWVGMVAGTAVGIFVPLLHAKKVPGVLSVLPFDNGGLQARWAMPL